MRASGYQCIFNHIPLWPVNWLESLMSRTLVKLLRSCEGPTAIEYGLIAALIAVVTIAGLTSLGNTLNARYNSIATNVGS